MGMRVFEHDIEVVVNKRFHAARNFAKRHKRRIYLNRVMDHTGDTRELRVIGKSEGWFFEKSDCIGYVPADIVDKLVRTGMEDKVKIRLQMISSDSRHSIHIRFDIFGPKDDYEKYRSIF